MILSAILFNNRTQNTGTFKKMLGFYENKYDDGALFLVLKSLTYFSDADKEANPKMLVEITWSQIKETIIKAINDYIASKQ